MSALSRAIVLMRIRILMRHLVAEQGTGVNTLWVLPGDQPNEIAGLLIYRWAGYPTPVVVWLEEQQPGVVRSRFQYLQPSGDLRIEDVEATAENLETLRPNLERAMRC